MKGAKRYAIIAGAVTRIRCRSVSMDEALKQTLTKHEIEAAEGEFYANLRRDVESVLAGKWPVQTRQLEIAF